MSNRIERYTRKQKNSDEARLPPCGFYLPHFYCTRLPSWSPDFNLLTLSKRKKHKLGKTQNIELDRTRFCSFQCIYHHSSCVVFKTMWFKCF